MNTRLCSRSFFFFCWHWEIRSTDGQIHDNHTDGRLSSVSLRWRHEWQDCSWGMSVTSEFFFFLTPNVFFSSSILEFIKDFMFCHACYLKRMKTNLILRNEGSMWIFLCWGVGREPTFPALCVRACVCVCHIIHAISQSFDLILAKAINATPIHLSSSNFC